MPSMLIKSNYCINNSHISLNYLNLKIKNIMILIIIILIFKFLTNSIELVISELKF